MGTDRQHDPQKRNRFYSAFPEHSLRQYLLGVQRSVSLGRNEYQRRTGNNLTV